MRSDSLRLQDILEAIDVIEHYLPDDKSAFDDNPPLQSHIYRHLMIVCEAAWRLSPELKQKYPKVPWRQIEGMRHIMVHDYFKVNWARVYTTARDQIPILKPTISLMLHELPPEPHSA